MKILLTIYIIVLAGCNGATNEIDFRHHEPFDCQNLGTVIGSGKNEQSAYDDAKKEVEDLGGNMIVPDPYKPLETSSSNLFMYNATGFYCDGNT